MTEPSILCPDVLTRAARRVSRPVWLAMLSAFVTGLIVYGYAMTNITLCTGDALTNTIFNGNLVWLGRWSSHWLSALSTDYSMPAVSTLLMIVSVTLLAGVAVSLLRIRSTFFALLSGAVLMCHPSVGAILHFLHNADAYMIAALLGAVAVWLSDRRPGWWWLLIAVPMLTVGIGTYQATLSLAVALMFVRAVQRILEGSDDNRTLGLTAGRYAVLLVASVALYMVMVKVSTAVSGTPLVDYQSTSSMGQFTAAEFVQNFIGCFRDFKQEITFLSFRPGYYVNGYSNYLFVALCIALIPLCYLLGKKKDWLRTIILSLLTVLSPVFLCCIRLANPVSVESRMTYSMAGLYLLGIVLLQQLSLLWKQLDAKRLMRLAGAAASWLMTAILIVAVFVWSVGINVDLYKGKLEYDHLLERCARYLERVEAAEGYEAGMPIYIIGTPENAPQKTPQLAEPKFYYAFMVHYMDVPMPYGIANAVNAAAADIQSGPDFQDMPCWPEDGCVKRVDDAMVVKLGN